MIFWFGFQISQDSIFSWCPWKIWKARPFLNLHGRHVPSFVSGRGATIATEFGSCWNGCSQRFPGWISSWSTGKLLENCVTWGQIYLRDCCNIQWNLSLFSQIKGQKLPICSTDVISNWPYAVPPRAMPSTSPPLIKFRWKGRSLQDDELLATRSFST